VTFGNLCIPGPRVGPGNGARVVLVRVRQLATPSIPVSAVPGVRSGSKSERVLAGPVPIIDEVPKPVSTLMIHGATGYNGRMAAEHATAAGLHPVLAGRDGPRLATLASGVVRISDRAP
jgi:hypothetical protein